MNGKNMYVAMKLYRLAYLYDYFTPDDAESLFKLAEKLENGLTPEQIRTAAFIEFVPTKSAMKDFDFYCKMWDDYISKRGMNNGEKG